MHILQACKKYLYSYMTALVSYCCVAVLIKLLSILSPYLTGNFINGLIASESMTFVYQYCLLIAGLCIINILLGYLSNRLYIYLQMPMGAAYNLDVIGHIQCVSMSSLIGKDLVKLNQQINGDTNALVIFCLNLANSFLVNLITLPTIFAICFRMNALISGLFSLYCVFYVVIYVLARHKKFKTTYQYMETQNRFFSALFEQLQYIGFIRTQGVADYFRSRTKEPYQALYKATVASQKYSYFLGSIDSLLSLLSQITLYIAGASQILKGSFSVGGFIMFSAYFSVVLSSIRFFYGFGTTYQEAMVSYHRLQDLENIAEEPNGDIKIGHINRIQINGLNFSYGDIPVIKNLYGLFQEGEIYAVVGHNGCGKSTLSRILLGLYSEEVKEGSITVNNIPIQDIDKLTMRRDEIAYADQDSILFSASIKENIMMGDSSEERWNKAQQLAELLHIGSIVSSQENSTSISGEKLSGGEKQKISVIRALSKNSDFILLDEPTSSMDLESRNALMTYLHQIKSNKIILIITHDESIEKMCDRKIDLNFQDCAFSERLDEQSRNRMNRNL